MSPLTRMRGTVGPPPESPIPHHRVLFLPCAHYVSSAHVLVSPVHSTISTDNQPCLVVLEGILLFVHVQPQSIKGLLLTPVKIVSTALLES